MSKFGIFGALGENLESFSPLGFDILRNSDHETSKMKLFSVIPQKRYLNGQVRTRISDFST